MLIEFARKMFILSLRRKNQLMLSGYAIWILLLSIIWISGVKADTAQDDSSSAPKIKKPPMDSSVEMNTKISFFCQADGLPRPLIIWKRNGKAIAQTRYVAETFGDGLSTLRIEPVRDKDNNSIITCEAKNDKGQTNASAKLIVYNSQDLPQGFPVIIDDPKLKAVENNQTATMACSVTGSPTPRVLWTKNLMPLEIMTSSQNPRYSIATLGKPGTLLIQNSERQDEGKYECIARNTKGVAHSKSAHLYVKVRRVPPQFSIRPPRIYKVKSGGRAEINCVAYGHPMPRVFWRRSSTNLDMEDPETAPVGKNQLHLENITRTENFTCIALSTLGNINSEVTVQVKNLPDPPDVLKIVNTTSDSITLNWFFTQSSNQQDESTGAEASYKISYKRKYADKYEFIDGETTADTRIKVGGLEPFTEYEFRVHTVTDVGTGRASMSISGTTAESLPASPPKSIKSRPLNNNHVLVQWEPPEKPNGRITGYSVYYSTNPDQAYTAWQIRNVSEGTVAQLTELTPDKTYSIRVLAKNAIGFGPISDENLVYTKANFPGQPANFKVVSTGPKEVKLTWDPPLHPDKLARYTIRYSNSVKEKDQLYKMEVKVPASVTDHRLENLLANTEYTFSVVAENNRGLGPASRPITVRTGLSVPTVTIDDVTAEPINSTSIKIQWQPISESQAESSLVTFYQIEVMTSQKPVELQRHYNLTDLKKAAMIVSELKPYTEYVITVAVGSSNGLGSKSTPVVFIRTLDDDQVLQRFGDDATDNAKNYAGVPGEPRDVTVTVLNETSVKIVWDEPNEPTSQIIGYIVRIFLADDPANQALEIKKQIQSKELTYVDLKPGTLYAVKIGAYNQKGDGKYSAAKTFRTLALKPLPPTGINHQFLKHMTDSDFLENKPIEVRILWDAPANLKNEEDSPRLMFKFKYKDVAESDDNFSEVYIQNATHYDLSDLKYGKTYEFRVVAEHDGQYSDEARNRILMPIGIPNAPPQNIRYKYSKEGNILEFMWDPVPEENRNGEIVRYQYLFSGDDQKGKEGQEIKDQKLSIQGVTVGKNYEFKVRAGTIRGFGNWSSIIRPTWGQNQDYLVPILELTAMSNRKAGIRWQPINDEAVYGYRVQYTDQAKVESFKAEEVYNRTIDHMFIDSLNEGAIYQFCVQALLGLNKLSECGSHKELVLKPSRVVEDLECRMEEEKIARCYWRYNGNTPAQFEVSYHLNKTYRMHDGTNRTVDYITPVDNSTKNEIKISGLRFNTRYTFFVSVVTDETIYLPQSFSLVTEIKPPPEFDPPKIVNMSQKYVTLKLMAAADENGPVKSYWLIIAPANYSKNATDQIDRNEIMSNRPDDIYVATALTQDQLWNLPGQIIKLGDNRTQMCQFYGDIFVNKPLNPRVRYRAFLRAFVDIQAGKNYRSSVWSTDFALALPIPSSIYSASLLWLLAPLAVVLVASVIIGGICVFLCSFRKRRLLMAKRGSIAKVSLSALNGGCGGGGINETSKLLLSNDYSGPMPPPINGHVKPYETMPLSSNTMSGLLSADGGGGTSSDDLSSDHKRSRRSTHYPVPPSGAEGGLSLNRMPVQVVDFAQHIDRLKMDDNLLFSKEYESIETGHHFTWEHSSMDANKPKNRYANVIAYDHSRVVLNRLENGNNNLCSDYINANFIDGYRKPKAYIATQGPLPETFADFWRMIWEQSSATIVMLTKLEERTRIKCDQYWPNRVLQTYGHIQVVPKETIEFAYYSLRVFEITKIGTNEQREVKQLQFTAWPDHGVPDHPSPFLMFLKRVQTLNSPDSGPIVVHCSAGVGRTGAFIAVDCMLERLRYETTLDVCGCVAALRSQRNYMVQTEEQYVFAHEAVLDAVLSGCTEVPVAKLCAHIQKLNALSHVEHTTCMELEFRILSSLNFRGTYSAASLSCNKSKNRLVNILPYDANRVRLNPDAMPPLSDMSPMQQPGLDYVNASHIDGYRRRRAYVATQGPLHTTIEDLWRILWQQNSNIVVMLTKLREMGREKCYQYWPSDRGERYGNLTVEPIAEYNMPQYILREFKLADITTGQSRTVRHFQYTEWPDQGVPKSGEMFIDFIGQVHKTKEQFGQEGPITVHCSAGVGRTGVFICLSIVLERMRFEGVVDIFTTVKLLRTQRPNMVQSEDQYQFCYQAALEYLGSFDHYALQLTD